MNNSTLSLPVSFDASSSRVRFLYHAMLLLFLLLFCVFSCGANERQGDRPCFQARVRVRLVSLCRDVHRRQAGIRQDVLLVVPGGIRRGVSGVVGPGLRPRDGHRRRRGKASDQAVRGPDAAGEGIF